MKFSEKWLREWMIQMLIVIFYEQISSTGIEVECVGNLSLNLVVL